MLLEPAARRAGWADHLPGPGLLADTATILDAELRKVARDPIKLLTRAAQPLLWLLVFGQLLAMPLFFASSAVYPVALMPDWLRAIALVNPLTYMVDALRTLMVVGGTTEHGLAIDATALAGGLTILILVATRLYPRLAQ